MYKRGRTKVAMMTNWPELFENLPYPAVTLPFDHGALHCIERAGVKVFRPKYIKFLEDNPTRYHFQKGHFIESMCRSVGIEGTVELRPHVAVTKKERSRWANCRGSIIVQTSRANPRFELQNKEWVTQNWHQLSKLLDGKIPVVQIGSADDPAFEGARDLRGKTTLRDAMAILSNAGLFLGVEGFLMHLAAAVQTSSVIIYGGYLDPSKSGYPENTNLFTELPCSPCGLTNHCEYDRECMRRITPEMVVEAVRKHRKAKQDL